MSWKSRLTMAVEDRFRPEIRRMERSLVLQILDTAWKDHLLAMDHLRSSVGLRGYAQVDPKVEYKREGMRIFEQMWTSVDERVTDLIFRMEQLDEDFVGSTWVESEAIHEEARRPAQRASPTTSSKPRSTTPNAKPSSSRSATAASASAATILPLRQRQEIQELPHEKGRSPRVAQASRTCSRRLSIPKQSSVRERIPSGGVCCWMALYLAAARRWPSPWLVWQSLRTGKYREGLAAKFLGLVPRRQSRSPLRLAACRQRRRSEPAGAAGGRDRPLAGPTGNASSRRPRAPAIALAQIAISRADGLLLPAGFQLGRAAGHARASARDCWCWPSSNCGRI